MWIALLTPPLAIVLVLAMERIENQVTPALPTAKADRQPPARKVVKPRVIEVQRWPARASRPDRGRQKAPVRPR